MYSMSRGVRPLLLFVILNILIFSGCSFSDNSSGSNTITSEKSEVEESLRVRTVQDREDALEGEVITPPDFPKEFFPGLNKVGVYPRKQYKIAFSNGDMGGEWRRSFWEDMEDYAQKYQDNFGIEYLFSNAGNDSTKQLQDIKELLAQKPDLLIVSPNEARPLSKVVDLCEKAKIPLITVDRTLDRTPGEGMYISAIMIDGYKSGIAQGMALVKKMTLKNGAPKGNIAEISGILGASPSRLASQGLRRVLKEYPEIKIVSSVSGEYNAEKSLEAARIILNQHPKGSLDAIITSSEDATLAVIDAIKENGRTELLGNVFGIDGTVGGINAILNGEVYEISEEPPYFGMIAFEYAIHYLNGEEIPSMIPMYQRCLMADSPEKINALKVMVEATQQQSLQFVPATEGGYDLFDIDPEFKKRYYPKPYWEQPSSYLKEIQPYTLTK